MTVTHSFLGDNTSGTDGGAILNWGGTLAVIGSTLSGNNAGPGNEGGPSGTAITAPQLWSIAPSAATPPQM